MITQIRKVDFKCNCGKQAVLQVTRTNEDLPDSYVKSGTRNEVYCSTCVPADVKKMWNFEGGTL